jgi:NhaP-type Na+/H+ or K+/H+ antiporter
MEGESLLNDGVAIVFFYFARLLATTDTWDTETITELTWSFSK